MNAAAPPPLPAPRKSRRWARVLNTMLPGAGLIYFGRWRAGLVLAGLFLLTFGVAVVWFVVCYIRYLQLTFSDDLLKGDTLEQIGNVFPRTSLVILAAIGVIIHLVSMFMLGKVSEPSQ